MGVGSYAISGVYSTILFNGLVGFGLSMLIKCVRKGPQEFQWYSEENIGHNLIDIVLAGCTLVCFGGTFGWAVLKRTRIGAGMALANAAFYACFVVVITGLLVHRAVRLS